MLLCFFFVDVVVVVVVVVVVLALQLSLASNQHLRNTDNPDDAENVSQTQVGTTVRH